jgi:hypothetical protein
MAIRSIMFCDLCNPQSIRALDRRTSMMVDRRTGRRANDARMSVLRVENEPPPEDWLCDDAKQMHVCPWCVERVDRLSTANLKSLGLSQNLLEWIIAQRNAPENSD